MKNKQLSVVAEKLGVSRTTVSMALNHCHGVSEDLRSRILCETDRMSITGKPRDDCRVYIILPEVPTYFWGRLYESLYTSLKARGIDAKANIYSRLGNSDIVERYLDEAERLCAEVIIIAAKYDGLDARLERMASERAVFSICETISAKNVFYFGSDRSADARMLAQQCLATNGGCRSYLLLGKDLERANSFTEVMRSAGADCRAVDIGYEASTAETSRALDALYREYRFDAVACFDGMVTRICSAMKKCRIDVPIFGLELREAEKRYGMPVNTVCQDLETIAETTIDAAAKYLREQTLPSGKYVYVKSELVGFSALPKS